MTSHKTQTTRLVLLAATTLVVAACGSKGDDGYVAPMPTPMNVAPTMAAIGDRTSNQDTVVGPIEFGISDPETDAGMLRVGASIDGNSLVPADGVTLGGSGAVRSITLTPFEATTGAVNVSVTVTDPQGASTTQMFRVTVNARAASIREWSLATFAKTEADDVTAMNGFTFTQDADDPAIYQPYFAGEE